MGLRGFSASSLSLLFLLVFSGGAALAEGHIQSVQSVSLGRSCGIPYIKYSGIFAGQTGDSQDTTYRVPYVVRTPLDPRRGNGITLYEYPHFVTADASRFSLGYDFLFCRGFSQASVGYSNRPDDGNSILDSTVPDTFVQGGEGRDINIMADFAQALSRKSDGGQLLGNNSARRYITGFSNSSVPLATLLVSGRAEGLFEFAIPFTTDGFDDDFIRSVKDALADGNFTGKVIVVNDELDELFVGELLHDDNPQIRDRYRYYFTPGTSHIPENFNCDSAGIAQVPFDHLTPATFIPELRARFLEGHLWTTFNSLKRFTPPNSTQIADPPVDEKGNVLSVDIEGVLQPRLPFVELGEATFRNFNEVLDFPFNFLVGSMVDVESVTSLGYRNFGQYFGDFVGAAEAYRRSGAMLLEDELFFLARALAFPPNTLTQNFVDHYDVYVANRPDCADIP